jgi:protein-S-isoprenylcysteine O-methyltransferase Ste14
LGDGSAVSQSPFTRWIGTSLFLGALPLFLQFLVRFVAEGRGAPAPVAPTERLVVGGPFRWVRNPGYIAVLGLVVGEGLFLAHTPACCSLRTPA